MIVIYDVQSFSSSIYGGVDTGNIGGSVRTEFGRTDEGTGAANGSYYGGSKAGNIDGGIKNEITRGSIRTGITYHAAAGRAWYVEGDVITRLGTEGLVYGGNYGSTDMTASTSKVNRGNNTSTDFVGGGGYPAGTSTRDFLLNGNSTLIQENTLLRWTYGSSYSGITYGDTRNGLHGGIVDTLEGSGYLDGLIVGNASAYVFGGEVDWFFSGGSWGTKRIEGNVYAEVTGGTLNSHIGGHCGHSGDVITGNSDVLVTGGDFSGPPRSSGRKTFSAGASQNGHIQGDLSLTLDFRDSDEIFKLPLATYICGGRPYGAGNGIYVGTDENNKIDLKIYTGDNDTDSLKGKESNVVNTGDQIAMYTWILGVIISIGALVTKKRKTYK